MGGNWRFLAIAGAIVFAGTAGLIVWLISGSPQQPPAPEPPHKVAHEAVAPQRVEQAGLLTRKPARDEAEEAPASEPGFEDDPAELAPPPVVEIPPDLAATFDELAIRIRDSEGAERKAAIQEATQLALQQAPELAPELLARLNATASPAEPSSPPGEPVQP